MLVLVALGATPALAAPRHLTLREAVAIGIARNPDLGIATMAATAAEADAEGAAGAFAPVLALDASVAVDRLDPAASPIARDVTQDRGVGRVAVTKRFERGSAVELEVTATFARRTLRIPVSEQLVDIPLEAVTPRAALSWTEPFAGGRGAGSAERRRLAALQEATRLERAALAATVVRDIERAYWELHVAEREVAIRGESVAFLEEQIKIVEAEVARGARARLAATELEDERARRVEDALVAEAALSERSLALARVLGLEPTTALRASDRPPRAKVPDPALDAGRATAPRLAAATAHGSAAAAALDRIEDETRIRVDGFVRASVSSESTTMADAVSRAAGYPGWTVETGLAMRIPLTGQARRGATGAARARLLQARIEATDVEAELASAILRERHRIELATARRAALARSIGLAETILVAEQRKWARGDGTSFEVSRREAALADVKLRALRAHVDQLDACASLEAVLGTLLERHDLELR